MDAAVQAFKDKMAEKQRHKGVALAAAGQAKKAELDGQDASSLWETVATEGIDGLEGKCMAEAQAMADAYVEAHPEKFVAFEQYLTPEGNEQLVRLIGALGKSGMEEAALELTMFELAKFERQSFGVAPQATVRLGNGG